MDVPITFLWSGPLTRDTYANLPDGVAEGNIGWDLLNPLYGLSTACKDWCGIIRDSPENECGLEVTSVDESVFFRTQQWFNYV